MSLRSTLEALRSHLLDDLEAVMRHDPAARRLIEVALTYPGVHALWGHRVSHHLWQKQWFLSARLISHATRFFTGVEIHPGAKIGRGVFIDHGMGIVIGETATIGEGCILYQGAVLGGTSTARKVRHPQLGRHVVVGASASVLGAIEVGDGARIGSGSVVIRSVPAGATVVGVPGRIVPSRDDHEARFEATLDHASLPDPVSEMLRSLRAENARLKQRVQAIEKQLNLGSPVDQDEHLVDGQLLTVDLPAQHGG